MQSFEQMIAKISTNLDRKLPGTSAHKKLQPYYPSAKNLSIPTNPFAKKSAVLVLLFPKNNQINVVFIERPANTGVHSKQISFPGGGREKNDKNYTATALRETYEEIGIEASKIQVLGKLSKLYVVASNYLIQPIVGFINKVPTYRISKNEVDNIIEMPLVDLIQAEIMEKPIHSAMGITLQAPYYDLEGRTLWGATAMITSELVDLSTDILKNIEL